MPHASSARQICAAPAMPLSRPVSSTGLCCGAQVRIGSLRCRMVFTRTNGRSCMRSEEHTSELQSRRDLVCRLLLEKKKNQYYFYVPKYPKDNNNNLISY